MTSSVSLTWFARHEIRLAWREWLAMMTGGRLRSARNVAIAIVGFAAVTHLLAYAVVARFSDIHAEGDPTALIVVTGSIFLAWALMVSQAIESVTRVFYSRADLDLIMSSPVAQANIFSVRMAAIAVAITAMGLLLSAPFIDVLAVLGGARWLAAYGVVVAGGLSASAVAIVVASFLFRTIGPGRTRLMAQIVSAIVGAGFVIALQIAAIISYGTLSRFAVLTSHAAASVLPELDSAIWWPGRAVFGDIVALLALISGSLVLLGVTMVMVSPRLGSDVAAASTTAVIQAAGRASTRAFRGGSRRRTLWRKEFLLLRRDPWLVSQTLMQLLYLIPPAVMLWRGFDDNAEALIVLTPVIVMAAGQLSGGLAWLTISGEDASDLVATSPLSPGQLIGAKIDVVLITIGILFAPLVLALAIVSPMQALVTAVAAAIAALSATAVQLWFRVQARRSQFRRRQTSSRIATFAEAFASIGWAATAAVSLSMPVLGVVTGLMTLGVIAAAYKAAPRQA